VSLDNFFLGSLKRKNALFRECVAQALKSDTRESRALVLEVKIAQQKDGSPRKILEMKIKKLTSGDVFSEHREVITLIATLML